MWLHLGIAAGAYVVVEALAVVVLWRTLTAGVPRALGIAIAAAIGALVLLVVLLWLAWTGRNALATFAENHHGEVCPFCRRRPKLEPGDERCCARAPRGWTREQYVEYWTLARKSLFSANLLLRSGNPTPRAVTLVPAVFIVIGAAFMGSLAVWRGDVFGGVVSGLRYLAFFGGFTVLMRGINVRRSDRPRCVRCGYEQAPDAESTHCPECGFFWRRAGGTTRTMFVRDGRFIALGAVMIVLAAASWINSLTGGTSFARRLQPTSSLIASAGAGIASGNEIWNEIAVRTLTLQEERALCDRLLDARHSNPLLFGPPSNWMNAYFAAGKATPEQIHRLRAEAFGARLEAPSQARVGESVRVTVRGSHREEFLPPANGVTVHVGGQWFADESTAPRPTTGQPGYWTLDIANGRSVPVASVTSSRAGSREIVVRLWFIARSYGHLAEPVDWNDDGTPILPADGLWAESIDVRAPITIVE